MYTDIYAPHIKHPKNWETALWGKEMLYWKKGFIKKKSFIEIKAFLKKGFIDIVPLLK